MPRSRNEHNMSPLKIKMNRDIKNYTIVGAFINCLREHQSALGNSQSTLSAYYELTYVT